ncbi:uncharacterized protein [Littorina saxatilis]
MINNTMPQASTNQGWNQMLEGSPLLLPDYNKSFFDFADCDIQAFDAKAGEPVASSDLVMAEGFIPVEGAEATYTTLDSTVILTFAGEEYVTGGSGHVGCIPTTALEMASGDVDMEEDGGSTSNTAVVNEHDGAFFGTVVMSGGEQNSVFLSVNLPVPSGNQPTTSSHNPPATPSYRPPLTPSPFSPPSNHAHPPSTPSCYSTCSEDYASTFSDASSTPDVKSVTSDRKFMFPVPTDDKMVAATLTALETNCLTPLIKEELKYTIQSRRLAAGKPELVVDAKPLVKVKKQMTAEERERAGKRRDQNRVAAQRFRQKQKDTADVLTRKCRRIEGSNTTLRNEIKKLARESQELRQLLTSHLMVCPKVKVARP